MLAHIPTANWRSVQSLRWRKGKEEKGWFTWDIVFTKHIKLISSISLLTSLTYLNSYLHCLHLLYLKPEKNTKQHKQNVLIHHPWPQTEKCFWFLSLKVILLWMLKLLNIKKKKIITGMWGSFLFCSSWSWLSLYCLTDKSGAYTLPKSDEFNSP